MLAGARAEGRAPPSSPVVVDRVRSRKGSNGEEVRALRARAPVLPVLALGMDMLALARGHNTSGVGNTRRCIARSVDGRVVLTDSLCRWF